MHQQKEAEMEVAQMASTVEQGRMTVEVSHPLTSISTTRATMTPMATLLRPYM